MVMANETAVAVQHATMRLHDFTREFSVELERKTAMIERHEKWIEKVAMKVQDINLRLKSMEVFMVRSRMDGKSGLVHV